MPRLLSHAIVADVVRGLDVAVTLGTGLGSYALYVGNLMDAPAHDRGQYLLGMVLVTALFSVLAQQQHAYQYRRLASLAWQLGSLARNLLLAFAACAVGCFLLKISAEFSRGWALLWIATDAAALTLGRTGICAAIRRGTRGGWLSKRRAVVGEGAALDRLLDALREQDEEAAEIVGIFGYGGAAADPQSRHGAHNLVTIARSEPLDEIILALPERGSDRLEILLDRLRELPVNIRVSLPLIADGLPICGIGIIGSLPVIDVAVPPLRHRQIILKWLFDQTLALLLTTLISPILLTLALLIKLDSRGPVFFVQERFGLSNNVIRVIKFRTMYVGRGDPSGGIQTTPGDARITRVGRFLRAHSLDELPQLFNVLRGEMSLVGPRPHALTMKAGDRLYHEAVSGYFARHRVKPGITGWAQVNGLRGETTSLFKAKQRVDHDLYYIDNWSIWFDLKILFLSAKVLLGTENAY